MFNVSVIADILKEKKYSESDIDIYCAYCIQLLESVDRRKNNAKKNPWMAYKTDDDLINFFISVKSDRLTIDGKHVTIQSTGVSYDYVAYKNKMLMAYPESLVDVQLVYRDDTFSFKKDSGKVLYSHVLNNPFEQNSEGVKGGYCVIKNKRGEFLTLISKTELEKHRKVAKTDSIWKNWTIEMYMKTLIKKACKQHFQDIFQNIETIDNQENDIEQPVDIELDLKQDLEGIKNLEELTKYFHDNKAKYKGVKKAGFDAIIVKRSEELKGASDENS